MDYLEFAKFMMEVGVKNIIFTDIETDGALSGPSFARLEALKQVYTGNIVTSGGVSSNEDIRPSGPHGGCTGPSWERRTTRGRWIWPRQCGDAGRQD